MGAVRAHRHSCVPYRKRKRKRVLISPVYLRYLLEHGLKPDGKIDSEAAEKAGEAGSYETFFTETSSGKYVPRSIFVDLDPSVRILLIKNTVIVTESL